MNNNTFIIAQNGIKYILVSLGFTLFFALFDWDFLTFLSLVSMFFLLYIFRNPERVATHFQNKNIVSVCDGEVLSIENVDSCELFNDLAVKIEIKTSCLDTSYLRAPFDATVSEIRHIRGAQLSRFNPLSFVLNEYAMLKYEDKDDFVVIQHRVENSFEPLHVYVDKTQNVKASERVGFMLKGITTMYLPLNSRISLHVGDTLKASESLIGYFSDSNE